MRHQVMVIGLGGSGRRSRASSPTWATRCSRSIATSGWSTTSRPPSRTRWSWMPPMRWPCAPRRRRLPTRHRGHLQPHRGEHLRHHGAPEAGCHERHRQGRQWPPRRILERVGATRVVYPEREIGQRVAHMFSVPEVVDYLDVAPSFGIQKVRPPAKWVGRTLADLDLLGTLKLTPIAVRRGERVLVDPPAQPHGRGYRRAHPHRSRRPPRGHRGLGPAAVVDAAQDRRPRSAYRVGQDGAEDTGRSRTRPAAASRASRPRPHPGAAGRGTGTRPAAASRPSWRRGSRRARLDDAPEPRVAGTARSRSGSHVQIARWSPVSMTSISVGRMLWHARRRRAGR